MHTRLLKLVYIHNELQHILANHVAIIRDVKYKRYNTSIKCNISNLSLFHP
jgi:hypothetical protein